MLGPGRVNVTMLRTPLRPYPILADLLLQRLEEVPDSDEITSVHKTGIYFYQIVVG
jgi:hypothetical protein